jgi:hypothetical protein
MRSLISAMFVLMPVVALADGIPTNQPLAYTGTLLNSVGAPVTTTTSLSLSLWDDPVATTTGNRKCEALAPNITPDAQGRFQVVLEAACLTAVKANPNLWVQVQIGLSVLPRSKLSAVPYAVEADRAALATNATNAVTAGTANSATTAVTASSATNATNAVNATNATNATNAANATSAVTAATAGAVTGSLRRSLIVLRTASCIYGSLATLTDCTCNSDEWAVGGGAYAGGQSLNESRNPIESDPSGRTWRLACITPAGARVQCINPQVICLKVS